MTVTEESYITHSDPSAIILDFFAGFGSTAEAVVPLNHEDGTHRRFIVVQLPEPTPGKAPANEAGITISARAAPEVAHAELAHRHVSRRSDDEISVECYRLSSFVALNEHHTFRRQGQFALTYARVFNGKGENSVYTIAMPPTQEQGHVEHKATMPTASCELIDGSAISPNRRNRRD